MPPRFRHRCVSDLGDDGALQILYNVNKQRKDANPHKVSHNPISKPWAYTTYMVAVCIGLRKGYGARVGALYIGSRISRSHIR